MKLRILLKTMRRFARLMESTARARGLEDYYATSTRRAIRKHRIGRPAKRRARRWTTK